MCYNITMQKLPEIGCYEVEVFEKDDHLVEVWSQNGDHHRVGGPAVTYFDKATGKAVIYVYKQNGVVHRDDGAAHIQINPKNDVVHLEEHYQHGKLHRIGYSAYIRTNPETGNHAMARSYENGERVYKSQPVGAIGTMGFEL